VRFYLEDFIRWTIQEIHRSVLNMKIQYRLSSCLSQTGLLVKE